MGRLTKEWADGPGKPDKDKSGVLRDFCAAAKDDPRKQEIQLRILDTTFKKWSHWVRELVDDIFDSLTQVTSRHEDPEKRMEAVIAALMRNEVNPVKVVNIKLNPQFTDITKDGIRELPGYIQLHEFARELDVAVDVAGFTDGEMGQPRIIVDVGTSYKDGELKTTCGYPVLPEVGEEAPAEAAPERPPGMSVTKRFTM